MCFDSLRKWTYFPQNYDMHACLPSDRSTRGKTIPARNLRLESKLRQLQTPNSISLNSLLFLDLIDLTISLLCNANRKTKWSMNEMCLLNELYFLSVTELFLNKWQLFRHTPLLVNQSRWRIQTFKSSVYSFPVSRRKKRKAVCSRKVKETGGRYVPILPAIVVYPLAIW